MSSLSSQAAVNALPSPLESAIDGRLHLLIRADSVNSIAKLTCFGHGDECYGAE